MVYGKYKPLNILEAEPERYTTSSLLEQVYKKPRVQTSDDVLRDYIAEGEVHGNCGPLDYWKVNASRFPGLAAMARDVLSVQGTSVACERLFSLGKNIISPARNRLKPDVVEALMKIKSYYQEWE